MGLIRRTIIIGLIGLIGPIGPLSFAQGISPDGRIEITYWHKWSADWQEMIEEIVMWFNESQDEIWVHPLLVPGNRAKTKFLTAVVGGDPPDLMTEWDPVIPQYAASGLIMSLDDLMAQTPGETEAMSGFLYPVVERMGSYKGELYALPFAMNTFRVFYNKRAFAEAGIEKTPETLAELEDAIDRLFKFDKRGYIKQAGFELGPWPANMIFPAFGGHFYDPETDTFDCANKNNVAALEWICRVAQRYGVKQMRTFDQANQSYLSGSTDPFISQRVAMRLYGQWAIYMYKRAVEEEGLKPVPYDTFVFPAPPGGRENSTYVNGNFNIIPHNSRHPREAWTFMRWLAGFSDPATGAKVAVRGGWVPASPRIAEQPHYQAYLKENPRFAPFVDLMESPNAATLPAIPAQSFFNAHFGAAVDYAMWGIKTPKEALEDLNREMEFEHRRMIGDIEARRARRERETAHD